MLVKARTVKLPSIAEIWNFKKQTLSYHWNIQTEIVKETVNLVLLKNKRQIGRELAAPKNRTMTAYKRCESKALLITKPDAKCTTVVIFTLRPLWPWERVAHTHWLES
jgi:hypothetical protein